MKSNNWRVCHVDMLLAESGVSKPFARHREQGRYNITLFLIG